MRTSVSNATLANGTIAHGDEVDSTGQQGTGQQGTGHYAATTVPAAFSVAQQGYHGPREIMTIENGFFDAFLGLPSAGHDVMVGLGEEYLMREVAYKRYPVGGPDQTPLFAFLHLIKDN